MPKNIKFSTWVLGDSYEDYVNHEIVPNLDEPLGYASVVVHLQYPFEKSLSIPFSRENGVTLRDLIDITREGFALMYKPEEDFGEFIHTIDDLSLEGFSIADDGTVSVSIDS